MTVRPGTSLLQAKAQRANLAAMERLAPFVRLAWHLLNPNVQLEWSWHMDAICEHLEAVTNGQIRRLVINVPPAYSKSTIVSQCWPIWEWLQTPENRWGFAAYGQDLTVRDSLKRRALIESAWYQSAFQPKWSLSADQRLKTVFGNNRAGEMVATSVGGRAMGYHFDRLVVDDPIKAGDIYTSRLESHVTWFHEEFETRLRDYRKSTIVLIMQRLHGKDLAGDVLRLGGWEHLCMDERFIPKKRSSTSIGWLDPRTKPDELLEPVRFPEEVVNEIWGTLSSAAVAAQRQQDPKVGEGTVYAESDLRNFWHWSKDRAAILGCKHLDETVTAFDEVAGAWDTTFEAGQTSDFCVGVVGGTIGADIYLLDLVRDRMDFVRGEKEIAALARRWDHCRTWLVEKAANGPGIVARLKSKVRGIRLVGFKGESKLQRADSVAPIVSARQLYFPHPEIADWVEGCIEELTDFPRGLHDDQVDAIVHLLRHFDARQLRPVRTLLRMPPRRQRIMPNPGEPPQAAVARAAVEQVRREGTRSARRHTRAEARERRRGKMPPKQSTYNPSDPNHPRNR